ncbi:hypothetical protein GLYMA_13G193750v4 [Glycine max]|nr:hypothetical protein GLYMA_13G193750v4 [Glycine max]KAH1102318.1 hypothetical protein GYH30_036723 [Glycine max]
MCLFPANVFVADYSFVGAMRGRWKSHHLCDFNKFSIVILTCAAMRLQFRPWLLSPCLPYGSNYNSTNKNTELRFLCRISYYQSKPFFCCEIIELVLHLYTMRK